MRSAHMIAAAVTATERVQEEVLKTFNALNGFCSGVMASGRSPSLSANVRASRSPGKRSSARRRSCRILSGWRRRTKQRFVV